MPVSTPRTAPATPGSAMHPPLGLAETSIITPALESPASEAPPDAVTGKVRWFNETKGYGFIADDATGNDVFVHYAAIQAEGFKTLRDGEDVRFEMEQTPKGSRALRVWRVSRVIH